MNYPDQPEILLTARQAHLFKRMMVVLPLERIEQFVAALEELEGAEYARVTVVIHNGHPRFVEQTKGYS